MLEKLIRYFAEHHMLVNFITIAVIMGAIFAYQKTGREEMPNYELNNISIRTAYPGASPEDVEQLVTKRLERNLKGIDGVYMMRSTSTSGSSQIIVEFVPGYADMDRALNDIRNQIADVRLPSEVRNQPSVRQFKTTRRAVMDVAVYFTDIILLTREDRYVLQQYAYNFSDQIGNLPQVSEVSTSGYYKNELQIVLDPAKLRQYNVPTSEVINALRRNNLRSPAGSLEDEEQAGVTVVAELDTVEQLHTVIIRSSFDSPAVRLSELATIRQGFSKINSISKVNGREAIILNVRKTADGDIIKTTDMVRAFVEKYQKEVLAESPVEVQVISDASRDVRNRLYIILSNGLLGIILLLVFLFLFMDARSALWVAMGIPFTFCITAITFPLIGYTINNTTLAAIIIVMGLIVDDAIVVAENVARHRAAGKTPFEAVIIGTREVFLPILAAITTTCAAFIPLLFFSGRYGQMLVFIPPVVIIMLVASLLETLFILPTHLGMHMPKFLKHPIEWVKTLAKARRESRRYSYSSAARASTEKKEKQHWFTVVEKAYGRLLYRILPYRAIILVFGACLLALAAYLFATQLRFVLFPDEESNEIIVHGNVRHDATRPETEYIVRSIESVIKQERPGTVSSYRTSIGRNRRGRNDQTGFSITVQMNHRDEREKTSTELANHWRQVLPELPDIELVQVATSRFGSSSGSVIEVEVRENDDTIRRIAAEMVRDALKVLPRLANAEVDDPLRNPEYRINLNRELITRLSINPSEVATALRTVLEGTIIAELNSGEEEVDLRVSVDEEHKYSVLALLQNFVENSGNYLVTIAQLVNYERILPPAAITRILHKRTTMVYASPEDENAPKTPRRGRPQTNTETQAGVMQNAADEEKIIAARQAMGAAPPQEEMTPIEIALYLEEKVFPEIQKIFPSVVFGFSGEIKDTRESSSDIFTAVIMVLFLMFVILALIFGSFVRPLVIMLTIPFSMVGVVLAFWMHGIEFFGLFATIGAIGLAGVIINDSILMVDKLDRSVPPETKGDARRRLIAENAATRLCAITLTTLTTVCAIMPTAYGFFGYDSMLTQMMLAISWGLLFGTLINLVLIPCVYTFLGPSPKKDAGYTPHWEGAGGGESPKAGSLADPGAGIAARALPAREVSRSRADTDEAYAPYLPKPDETDDVPETRTRAPRKASAASTPRAEGSADPARGAKTAAKSSTKNAAKSTAQRIKK